MKKYEQQYYFLRPSKSNDSIPVLTPEENTSKINYDFEKFPIDCPPFVFFNGAKEYDKKQKIKSMKKVPSILFCGSDLLVPGTVREALSKLNISDLHMHPAVYLHDDGKWFVDYWYMAFLKRFDCWSREESDYEKDEPPVRLGGFELHQVYRYSLNNELLGSMPESERLLFKMGGTLLPFIVCHESVLSVFQTSDKTGMDFIRVDEY